MKYDDYDIIFDDENILGKSWEIERYIEEHLYDNDGEWVELGTELLKEVKEHDGYVYCSYHPMGAYTVFDLYYKINEKEYEELW